MKKRSVLAVLLAGAFVFSSALPSVASVVDAPADGIADIRSELSAVGVEGDVQDRLIEKLENGIPWDSITDGVQPVSVETEEFSTETRERKVYADGSVAVSRTEKGNEFSNSSGMQARKISGCVKLATKSGWSRWGDCKSDVNLVLVRMTFNFDYSLKKGKQARIDRIFNHSNFCTCFVDKDSQVVTRKYSDGAAPATARASVRYTIGPWKGVGIVSDGWSQANVDKNGKTWSTHN